MPTSPDTLRIPAEKLKREFFRVLVSRGFPEEKAEATAAIFTNNSLEGVYTHSVNRFPKFVHFIEQGYIRPEQEAVCKHRSGGIEQWDGQLGIGVLNAMKCTDRAMALASEHSIGCVALANTNHWMRGGAYGWHAARKGFIFIGWTNTNANMPAWGGIDSRLGNNPLIIAVPFEQDAIVLDMAMSQYSYGALDFHRLQEKKLPVPGGYDERGNLTDNPASILASKRTLPVGYWKGAGLSLLLDILATVLSGGLSTSEITKQDAEINVSQVFISIDPKRLGHNSSIPRLIHQIIDDYHDSVPERAGHSVRYPGENVQRIKTENLSLGIPVLRSVWTEIESL